METNKIQYSYSSALISLRSYIADTVGSSIDGVAYYHMHKKHKCYKCGIRGHIAADCNLICRYCNNKHINGVCIWHINDFIEKILRKLEEPTEELRKAQLIKYAETLKEKYEKEEGEQQLKFNKYAATFKVSKTNAIELKPNFYTTTLTIPATVASGNKNPCFVTRVNEKPTKMKQEELNALVTRLQQIRTQIIEKEQHKNDYYNECVGKYGKKFETYFYLESNEQLTIETAKRNGLDLPYFGKMSYIKKMYTITKELNTIRSKHEQTIKQLKQKEQEILQEVEKDEDLIYEYKNKTRTKLGNMGITMGTNLEIKQEMNTRKNEYYKLRLDLIKLMNKVHTNPLLEEFYKYIKDKKTMNKQKDKLAYTIDNMDKILQRKKDKMNKIIEKKDKIIAKQEDKIQHKTKIVRGIIDNAKAKAEKLRNMQIKKNIEARNDLTRAKNKYAYLNNKMKELTGIARKTKQRQHIEYKNWKYEKDYDPEFENRNDRQKEMMYRHDIENQQLWQQVYNAENNAQNYVEYEQYDDDYYNY